MTTSEATKRCPKCEEVRDVKHFAKHSKAKDGLQCWCRRCQTAHKRAWREHPDNAGKNAAAQARWTARNPNYLDTWRTKYYYGITTADVAAMWAAQDGNCASCQDELRRGRGQASIDHDHDTGKVRGICCTRCNTAAGLLRDEPLNVGSLMVYLGVHGKTMTPQQWADFVAAYEPLIHGSTH